MPPHDDAANLTQLEVARSLDGTVELLPFLPALLADLAELGGSATQVVSALRRAGLAHGARVLDLGCGKGAVALAVARELGAAVEGVDGMREFVEEAARAAIAAGLTERCRFVHGDLRDAIGRAAAAPFDAVLLVAVGTPLGGLAATVAGLRRCVRPGGLVLIDHAFGHESAPDQDAGDRLDHGETLRALAAGGDEVVVEVLPEPDERRRAEARMLACIRRRATELAVAHPAAARILAGYVEEQEAAVTRELATQSDALWVVRVAR